MAKNYRVKQPFTYHTTPTAPGMIDKTSKTYFHGDTILLEDPNVDLQAYKLERVEEPLDAPPKENAPKKKAPKKVATKKEVKKAPEKLKTSVEDAKAKLSENWDG